MTAQHTDELLRAFLERLAAKQGSDLAVAAEGLMKHEWGEVTERYTFYPALRQVIVRDPLDAIAVLECVQERGNVILGGHASFRSRVKDFFESEAAAELLKRIMGDGTVPPTVERIDEFIQSVVDHGFRRRQGNPAGGDAVYFTSVLLTAVFPEDFVDCRMSRWDWMARQFDLPTAPNGASYAVRLKAAASAARQLADTPAFRQYFSSEHLLWTAGGLAFLVERNPELRTLVEDRSEPVDVDADVVQAFRRFREDPASQFMVRLRRRRAEQLRTLLADPDSIDLATFNRDVWNVWTSATLNGRDAVPLLARSTSLSREELQDLEAGLESGNLQVHGNCMWGSATRIFGPMVPGGDDDRLAYVRQALEILNDENIEPLAKAKQILEIPGFGPNIATGLLMVVHPAEIAIWNTPSISAVSKMGYHPVDLASFQAVVDELRRGLGADDYIELDCFLFLLDQGVLGYTPKEPAWWVCQGTMYDHERKGGYVFAPKETSDGKVVQHHANLAVMKPGQTVLHYAAGAIQAVGTVQAVATEQTRSDVMPGEEPGRIGYHVRIQYRDMRQPIALEEIPETWRQEGEQPFTRRGKVKQGYLFPISHTFLTKLRGKFADRFPAERPLNPESYVEPPFEQIRDRISAQGLRISERTLRRYHLSLKTRGFVILCGLSGSGKTWLAELYAKAVGAESELVPVASNWTTNEDLIGYLNPLDGLYRDTPFSRFLRRTAKEFEDAEAAGVLARPFHLILDEMNLARVEYYFAKFLSAMEQRSRSSDAHIDLGGNDRVSLPPNLFFIGTVNVDETTHGFADKVYDRAQLIEVDVDRDALRAHLGEAAYADVLLEVWDALGDVAPFAFRVLDEIKSYVGEASRLGVDWKEAVDEQLLQKVLTKIKGAEQRVEKALKQFQATSENQFPLSHAKAQRMLEMLDHHGITSYF